MHRQALLALSLLAATAPAQWPTTSSPNLPIGATTGEQVLPKVAATGDGGCYVGWFDNRAGSYAVYLQRYDAAGQALFAANGLLVSGNPQQSSLVDWDLICDRADHCVLTFTDIRAGGDLDVYAYRIAPDGTFVWGANGIALSNNADFEPNPRVCQAWDDDLVFVWSNSGTATVQMQRVAPDGTVRFAGDGTAIPGDAGQTPGFANVVSGVTLGAGDVVVSWVRGTSSFLSPRHIHAQRFDALGQPLWNGGTRIAVFDQTSIPIAHIPKVLPDRFGGAVFAWHFAVGSQFSARVQHISSSGTEVHPHNGIDVSSSANSKFDPAIVWSPSTSEALVAWNERNVAQTSWGIFAQKVSSVGGGLQWGATGVQLLPIDTTVKFAPVAAPLRQHDQNDGIAVGVLVESLGLLQKSVQLFGLDTNGVPAFAPVTVSTFASDKLRLAMAASESGTQMLAWSDLRSGAADVFGAAVDLRGQLGTVPATVTVSTCGNNPPGSLVVTGRPAVGTTMFWEMGNPVGTQRFAVGFYFLAFASPGFPCGVPIPGFGMNGPGAPGDISVDITLPHIVIPTTVFGPGLTVPHAFTMPWAGSLIGLDLWLQGLAVDLNPNPTVPIAVTQAAHFVTGS
ncbi:MAG: hypothetical protein JNL08_00325 [Planctomycetes bacterium]|nr:hypothetical protein [Planctomycetota bacterium]